MIRIEILIIIVLLVLLIFFSGVGIFLARKIAEEEMWGIRKYILVD